MANGASGGGGRLGGGPGGHSGGGGRLSGSPGGNRSGGMGGFGGPSRPGGSSGDGGLAGLAGLLGLLGLAGSARNNSGGYGGGRQSYPPPGGGMPPGGPGNMRPGGNGSMPPGSGRAGGSGCGTMLGIGVIIIGIIFLVAIMGLGGSCFGSDPYNDAGDYQGTITESVADRVKLTGGTYQNEVYDEAGLLSSTGAVASGLRPFFEATGVQPAVYLTTSAELGSTMLEDKAQEIAEELNLGDNAFLFVFFDGSGDWTTWVGYSAGTVMDPNAITIFGDYLNMYWNQDDSWDELLVDTFTSTGERIMSRTTNANDAAQSFWENSTWIWVAVAIIAAGVVIIIVMRKRREHEAAKAAETERILKADIKDLNDDLLDKYSDKK